jgi:hypothetical protein
MKKYQVKPYEVARRGNRREAASVAPRGLPAFKIEASSDKDVRRLIRERYKQQGREVRCINAADASSYIVYVESK